MELAEEVKSEEDVKKFLLDIYCNYYDCPPDMELNNEVFYLFLTLLHYQQIVPVAQDIMDVQELVTKKDAEVIDTMTTNVFELPTKIPDAEELKADVKELGGIWFRWENYFIAPRTTERRYIKAFFKNVKSFYDAYSKDGVSTESIWRNVCLEIVKRKFSTIFLLTVRDAVVLILKAHGLKCPEIESSACPSALSKIRPHVEPLLKKLVKYQRFEFKNASRTYLIFAYMAYYAPPQPNQ